MIFSQATYDQVAKKATLSLHQVAGFPVLDYVLDLNAHTMTIPALAERVVTEQLVIAAMAEIETWLSQITHREGSPLPAPVGFHAIELVYKKVAANKVVTLEVKTADNQIVTTLTYTSATGVVTVGDRPAVVLPLGEFLQGQQVTRMFFALVATIVRS